MTIKKGLYIAVEGIDGSGKSSLIKALAKTLEANKNAVVVTKEPGGTDLGKTLRSLVQSHKKNICNKAEFLLFAADRTQHISSIVTPALEQGNIVISDRSFISSIAYQGYGRGLDKEMINKVNTWAMNDAMPDLIIYLALDPEIAFKRIAERQKTLTSFEQEKITFWQNVIKGFEDCCLVYKNMVKIDADRPLDVICNEVATLILNARTIRQTQGERDSLKHMEI
jgi:dTMP kinase